MISNADFVYTVGSFIEELLPYMNYLPAAKDDLRRRITEIQAYWSGPSFPHAITHGQWEMFPGYAHPRGLTGCAFMTSWELVSLFEFDPCDESTYFRSIRAYCPESCACRSSMAFCPVG